ncbi:MAG TPA: hypothetical protein VGU27_07725 [Candidatus Eisenbacteria bacterium]|nr:hypothetical protein [Candidatus Eisenbacteria bacterium]
MRVRHLIRLTAMLLVLGIAAGCKSAGTTTIKMLLDDPSTYDQKVVRIVGKVGRSIGALGYGAYTVDDGTGSLPVVTDSGGAPREGAGVAVEGEFRSAYTLGTQTAAVLIEHHRRVQ